ncbi:M3EW, histidine kinase-group I protein [Halenospora varia]|nr:M3EW, histidine kinase-group I protein [Halenospora varia]
MDPTMQSIRPRTETVRDMTESRRALELRKFFAPLQFANSDVENDFNNSLNNDGALDAYAETIVWRLRGVHAMVSLVDKGSLFLSYSRKAGNKLLGSQYFLAGAIRTIDKEQEEDVCSSDTWFGCSEISTAGGLCENTLALDSTGDEYPCFIIDDLSQDERFAHLPVVTGDIASYKFYAGTPITTSHGINIGSFFLFDDKPRNGLTLDHRKFLRQQATNVMRHLETKREAAERRRAALMSKGIADFLETTCRNNEIIYGNTTPPADALQTEVGNENDHGEDNILETQNTPGFRTQESVLDQIRTTLDHAADILRESLELTVGGVVFLDNAIGYSEYDSVNAIADPSTDLGSHAQHMAREERKLQTANEKKLRLRVSTDNDTMGRRLSRGAVRNSADKHKPSKVLAMSAANVATWDPESRVLDGKTLQSFITSYPKGNIWYIDEEGYFSSLEQIAEIEKTLGTSPSGRPKPISPGAMSQQRAEASMLAQVFHKARQIIFLPLWDAGADRWFSGCFVWSQSAVPVFTVDSEIAYLSAFTNSVMVEISRLDAITANKVKSDFISSISHEFRSPLHGILASTEFLRESELDTSQLEFIGTIQSCGGTLLDTINHVLDYSKINSFEKAGNGPGTIANELYQVTNLALLCEDIVHGMIAANEYRGTATGPELLPVSNDFCSPFRPKTDKDRSSLQVIIDIEHRDWDFKVQAGALRRVVMNIFGNAQKYTDNGYILVKLGVTEPSEIIRGKAKPTGKCLLLHIRDSGRGMSSEYMERKLYQPFAQEDSFAPGVGLGLSIVWSIVNQLGGKINIRSEIGKGTDVEVTIPIEVAQESPPMTPISPYLPAIDVHECVEILQERSKGKSVQISRTTSECTPLHDNISWDCIERYCRDWFGFEVNYSGADLVITSTCNLKDHDQDQRILVIHNDMVCAKGIDARRHLVADIYSPIGPFKLARCILALLDRQMPTLTDSNSANKSDAGTQTPLGSPEERKVLNGIITTDYGFPVSTFPQVRSTNTPKERQVIKESFEERDGRELQALSGLQSLSLREPPTPKQTPPQQMTPTQSSSCKVPLPTLTTTASTSTESADLLPAPLQQLSITIPKPTPAIPPTQPPSKGPDGLHILAVDDNALNLQLLQRFLQKRKIDTIVTATNGLEAVTAYKSALSNPDPMLKTFDVIFMDISMPKMDGFEATRVIRRLERYGPSNEREWMDGEIDEKSVIVIEVEKRAYVVALTGLASRRDREEAVESGFDDYLTKPVSFAKIKEVLERLSKEKFEGVQKGLSFG